MFMQESKKHVVCISNVFSKTMEGLLKVTSRHVHCKCGTYYLRNGVDVVVVLHH